MQVVAIAFDDVEDFFRQMAMLAVLFPAE